MLEEYYWYRGCSEDGLPTEKRLREVGLADEAGFLEQHGCLGKRDCLKIEELAPPQF